MEDPLKEIMDNFVQDVLSDDEEIEYLASLDEMATVGRSQRYKLLIQVNPAEKQAGNAPYFKVYDAANESHATHLARIRFDVPLYEIHAKKFNRGKDYWWLNSKDKNNLINYLKADSKDLPQFINWKYAILSFNKERGLDFQQTQENLLEDGTLLYPDFLPFDLPMPDYTLLAPNERVNNRIKDAIRGRNLEEAQRIAKRILASLRG